MSRDDDLSYEQVSIRAELAWLTFQLAFVKFFELVVKARFNPNQPRVPAGHPDGGQWVRVNDGGSSYDVDLIEHEKLGGHTIRAHVNRSRESLLVHVRSERYRTMFGDIVRYRDGSFSSLEVAAKLVNATLARNRALVDQVARGILKDAFVTAAFGSRTGIEAYRSSARSEAYIRDTYGVAIYVVHDPRVKNGFRIQTAFPWND